MEIVTILIVCSILGSFGFLLTLKYVKTSTNKIILFVLLTITFFYIGKDTRLFSLFGFSIFLNHFGVSLLCGYTIGLMKVYLKEKLS